MVVGRYHHAPHSRKMRLPTEPAEQGEVEARALHGRTPVVAAAHRVAEGKESIDDAVAVTKNGVPAAVILSMEKYEGLLETLDILSDEKTMKSVRTSMRQARQGKWLKYEEVFGR